MRFFELLCDPVTTDANVYEVRKHFEESPGKPTWPLSQEVDISRTTVHRVIHTDLKLFPYKLQIHQTQTNVNKEEKTEFCQTISERIENNPGDFGLILFTDGAHFHLTGHVKTWGFRLLISLINIPSGH